MSLRTLLCVATLLALGLSACQTAPDRTVSELDEVVTLDTLPAPPPAPPDLDLDSLLFTGAEAAALDLLGNRSREPLDTSFEFIHHDSLPAVRIDLQRGHLTEDEHVYAYLSRKINHFTHVSLYLMQHQKWKPVLQREFEYAYFKGDSIFDVNGDGSPDLVLMSYPASGCCLANVHHVYLHLPNQGTFTPEYEFINPTFSPAEKLVRGVNYGHPGMTELYKYRWNGLRVDTLEWIQPFPPQSKTYVRTRPPLLHHPEKGSPVRSIPSEYRQVNGFDWFVGF